jgi:hypothetical protein
MYTVRIDPAWQTLAEDFATRTIESRMSKLKSRGQSNISKISQDIVSGALAEFGVRDILRRHLEYDTVSEPDLNLYVGKQKSFSADLVGTVHGDSHLVHVKSYSNPKWSSWVFTYNPDRGDVDVLIESPKINDYLALTYVDLIGGTVSLRYYLQAGKVLNCYRPPILPQLKFSKVVLYPEDLDRVVDCSLRQPSVLSRTC